MLGVFGKDVARLTAALDASVAAGDVHTFRRTCHALAGAAGVVGAAALGAGLPRCHGRRRPSAGPAGGVRDIRALSAVALADMAAFLASLPEA